METDPLVTMLVGGLAAAFCAGFLAHKLRLPLVPAYIIAGMLTNYALPGAEEQAEIVRELLDLGLVFLMFGLGLRFPPPRQGGFQWPALPGALLQICLVAGAGYGFGLLIGLEGRDLDLVAVAVALSSAYSGLAGTGNNAETSTPEGLILVSWLGIHAAVSLIAMIVLAAWFRAGQPDGAFAVTALVGQTAVILGVFMLVLVIAARRALPAVLVFMARSKSRELFALGVFSFALIIAYAAYVLFGAGFAVGAFLAGIAFNQAALTRRAGDDLIPFRDAFAVLFFVALGMMLDPQSLIDRIGTIAAIAAIIIFGNAAAVFLTTTALRRPMAERLILAAAFTQIGEFALLIGGAALTFELVSLSVFELVAAAAAVTLSINPLIRIMAGAAALRYG